MIFIMIFLGYCCQAQVIDVTSYGADGNDTEEDTNAFNSANAASVALGWDLVAPAGNYVLKDFLFVDGREEDGRTLRGDGDATHFIAATGASYVVGLNSPIGAGLERFSIDCNDVNKLKAIYFWGTGWRNHVTDVNVLQGIASDSNALYIATGTYTTHFQNCQFERAHLKGQTWGNEVTTISFTNCDLRTIRLAHAMDITFTGGVIGQAGEPSVRMYNSKAGFYGVDFEGYGDYAIVIDPNLNGRSWLNMQSRLASGKISGSYMSYTSEIRLASPDEGATVSLYNEGPGGNRYALHSGNFTRGYPDGEPWQKTYNWSKMFAVIDVNTDTLPIMVKDGNVGNRVFPYYPHTIGRDGTLGDNTDMLALINTDYSLNAKTGTAQSIIFRQMPMTGGLSFQGNYVAGIKAVCANKYNSANAATMDGYMDIEVAVDSNRTKVARFKDGGIDISGDVNMTGHLKTDGYPIGYAFTTYSAGAAYSLTVTPALLDFGTTDPTVVILYPGTWSIRSGAIVNYNGATFNNITDVTLKLHRINNTPGDIANASATVKTEITTTRTGTFQAVSLPEVIYTTSNFYDVIQLFGSVARLPSAGSLDVVQAWIVAERKY